MRRLYYVVLLSALLISGCAQQLIVMLSSVEIDTNVPLGGSGIVVTNTIPNSYLAIKRVGFHSVGAYGKISTGESAFVRATYVLDTQEIAVIVIGYGVNGEYLGALTRTYRFDPGRHEIHYWDIQRNNLRGTR